jgi:anti-anti-sigma factor
MDGVQMRIAPDQFKVTEFEFSGRPGIAVAGDVDEAHCGELETALTQLSTRGGQVFLDLQDCTFLDSKGLDVILRAAARLFDEGGQLTVHDARGPVRELFRITGLTGGNGLLLHRDVP